MFPKKQKGPNTSRIPKVFETGYVIHKFIDRERLLWYFSPWLQNTELNIKHSKYPTQIFFLCYLDPVTKRHNFPLMSVSLKDCDSSVKTNNFFSMLLLFIQNVHATAMFWGLLLTLSKWGIIPFFEKNNHLSNVKCIKKEEVTDRP